MSTLYDIARCPGVRLVSNKPISLCSSCARTDKGRDEYQVYIAPAFDNKTGICENYIKRGEA